jgi:hypothetical protein
MADAWYDIASPEHFWLRRRFAVLRRLADDVIRQSRGLAEVGCGHGVLQKQIEESYGAQVTGFDLNELALRQNVSTQSPVYCYDIMDRLPEFEARFSTIFAFDVLEHIVDEKAFLDAVAFHLAADGALIINVPAYQALYSKYDRVVGHVRRYSMRQLTDVVEAAGFTATACTYWGAPLFPVALLRKWFLDHVHSGEDTVSAGMKPTAPGSNTALGLLARCEKLPQRSFGTSVMAVFRRRNSLVR